MKRILFLLCLGLMSLPLFSQSVISGYIPEENSKKGIVNLIQLNEETPNSKETTKIIAAASVDDKGYFQFQQKLPTQPKFYYLSTGDKINLIRSEKFLLANDDSISFQKSKPPFSTYISNSVSNKEWQKFLIYEKRIRKKKKFLEEIRTYSKDSLQILAVKLISIKELEKKQLLDTDIALNKKYYSSFLTELKESDINPQEYLFLELKMTKLKVLNTEESYARSKWLNYVLGFLILGMVFFGYRYKSSKQNLATLSKQELAIKNLILQEKSNKEIASELFISVSTVKTHITNIYQKLQVVNRNDLMTKFKNSTGTST